MRLTIGVLGLLLVGSALGGCVRAGAVATPSGGRYVISEAELQQMNEFTLYEAIRRLRPHFLRSRTETEEGKMVEPKQRRNGGTVAPTAVSGTSETCRDRSGAATTLTSLRTAIFAR